MQRVRESRELKRGSQQFGCDAFHVIFQPACQRQQAIARTRTAITQRCDERTILTRERYLTDALKLANLTLICRWLEFESGILIATWRQLASRRFEEFFLDTREPV